MIDLDQRNVACNGQSLGERGADQQRTEQTGTARKGYGIDFVGCYTGLFERGVDGRDDILLMRPRSEFGNDAAVLFVYRLRGYDTRQQSGVAQYGCRCVVA